MRRSFPDSGVLIDAARGLPPFDRAAFEYFDSSDRIFLTSSFVRLETVPKAAYMRLDAELDFYTAFFNHPTLEYCREWDRQSKFIYRNRLVEVVYLYAQL